MLRVYLTTEFLDVAKFTTLTPLSLLILRELFPDCRFENVFLAYFRFEVTQQNFHIVARKLIKYTS
jgi:hypothetical protein